MFKKILVASDALDACDAPSILATNLAKQGDAQLHLMHVLESSYMGYRDWVKDFKTGEETVANAEYREAIKKTMEEKCGDAMSGLKDHVIHVESGFPWMAILKTARATKADLIVLGPHRGKAEEKGVVRTLDRLGSTVEAIIMRARCPVMIVSSIVSKERLAFKKILFCTDFSATCDYAFEVSLKMAQKCGSKLHIFHTLKIPIGGQVSYPREQIEKEVADAKEKLKKTYGDKAKEIDHSFDVWEGEPLVEIPKYARINEIDLINMGSHAREQDKRWYLGSVVEKVSLESYCPVITVTRPEALLKLEE
ncbi:MAG: universal stress protein [Deltaproteobacteria bacterium]|jgi:nucleotide-binding universal stress UspA family protein|nr:universal stress protein [Deltaproteobacteria bacterium]